MTRALGAAVAAALAFSFTPLALGQAAISCATELYAVSQQSLPSGQLFRVNTATGAGTLIGAAPASLTEVEYDAASGELWATDGSLGANLHRLNPATGAEISSVALNPSGPINGLQFVGNTLYGTRIATKGPGLTPSSLVTIDRKTGAVTTIGPTGLNSPVSGLAYDKTNAIMYGSVAGGGVSTLVKINLATGAATTVGSIGFTKVGSIEFGNDGILYGGTGDAFSPSLLRINTTTGAGTLIGADGGFRITGLAACPTGSARTFVSVNGTDSGACGATSPCRSLAYAITQTVALGEIQILDSGGYGGVTIDKSITIAAADGVYAGISVASGTGITVDAGPDGRVALRGLSINSLGGTVGIDLASAAALYVDDCTISGFTDSGLRALPAAASAVYVRDSQFRGNNGALIAGTTTSGTLELSVAQSQFEGNFLGIAITQHGVVGSIVKSRVVGGNQALLVQPAAGANATLDVRRSVFVDANTAIQVGGNAGAVATLVLTSSLVSENGTGIVTDNGATTYASDATIIRNGTGLQQLGSGVAISFQPTNRLLQNTSDGTFTSTVPES